MTNRTLVVLGFTTLGMLSGCKEHKTALPEAGQPVTTTGAVVETQPALALPDVPTLVTKVQPTVVNITTVHTIHARESIFPWIDPFGLFGGGPGGPGRRRPPSGDRVMRQQALGSGFIIDGQGHVVTNAHVVENADEVRVKLADEHEVEAKVKGRDERLDVAVLELHGLKEVPAAQLGSSEELRVGEYVVAVGNPFGLGNTVTMGIVSAKSRAIGAGPYDDFIQTDASINPGNSGGPLFNMRGQVVGIATAISATGQGIGFAIPVDALKDVLPQLLTKGHVERGHLGVVVQQVDEPLAKALGLERPSGALIGDVDKGGPADKAGLKPGDVIIAVDGTPITHSQELPRIIARHAPGSKVSLKMIREKSTRTIEVTLDKLRDEPTEPQSEEQRPEPQMQGDLGIGISDAPGGGALVERVAPNGAARDTLEPGDVIIEVNRTPVSKASEATAQIKATPRDQPILLKVRRDGRTRYVAIQRR